MNGICRLCIICHDVFDTYSFQLHNSGSLTVKKSKMKFNSFIQISTIFQILKYKFKRGENGRLARWAGLVQLQPTR